MFWHSDASNDYAIYRTPDGWSGPNYSQIEIKWPTGIRLDGGSLYGKSGVDIVSGPLMMGGTATINSSRQLVNCSAGTGIAGFRFRNDWYYDIGNNPRIFLGSGQSGHNKFRVGGSTAQHIFENSVGVERAHIDNAGNFVAEGNVTAYGSASDIRLKENIERIADPIDKVKQLDGITFDYKKDGSRSTGLIAQQLIEVLPEVVYEESDLDSGDTHYAVRYGQVVGLLVEAVKELTQRIEELENGNNEDD